MDDRTRMKPPLLTPKFKGGKEMKEEIPLREEMVDGKEEVAIPEDARCTYNLKNNFHVLVAGARKGDEEITLPISQHSSVHNRPTSRV